MTASTEPNGILAEAPGGGSRPHACSFPCNPPGGSFLEPGPCECGKTYAQGQADELLAAAAEAAAAAYPLPDTPFLTGVSDRWHAIHRADAEWAVRQHGKDPAVHAACGKLARLARAWPVYGEDRPRWLHRCPECAWTVAAETGDLDQQLQALIPPAADHAVLARLLSDPLIAVTAAARLVEAVTSGHADYDPDHPAVIQLLAAITRHAPVILVPEDCAEGTCGHCEDAAETGGGQPRECPRPDAAAACAECSLQAGQWAGEWEGQYLSECTITAPCPVLTALAEHAAKALEDTQRREQALAEWEAERAAEAALRDGD
jgi:hypothetical protein